MTSLVRGRLAQHDKHDMGGEVKNGPKSMTSFMDGPSLFVVRLSTIIVAHFSSIGRSNFISRERFLVSRGRGTKCRGTKGFLKLSDEDIYRDQCR